MITFLDASPTPNPTDSVTSGEGWAEFFAIDVSQAVQIVFWVVAGTIAVLTYRQAKGTVFQPLRVEVFKQQLAVLTRVSEDFVSRDESALRQYFDLENCVSFNAGLMFERFLEDVHGLKRKTPLIEEFREDFPGGVVSLESMESNFELVKAPIDTSLQPTTAESDTKDAKKTVWRRPDWDHYKHDLIAVSRGYTNAYEHVLALVRDPLVPRELAQLLQELADAASANLHAIEPAMAEAAQKVATSYATFDGTTYPDLAWVSNIWNRKSTPLEPIAGRIGEFTRAFVESERSGFATPHNRRSRTSRTK